MSCPGYRKPLLLFQAYGLVTRLLMQRSNTKGGFNENELDTGKVRVVTVTKGPHSQRK